VASSDPRRANGGRTPAVIVSVSHLDDEERALVLGVLLEELVTYMRMQPGSKELRALIAFDEVYGLMPPHPRNPPTKRPLVTLMKRGRAFGLGVLVATQKSPGARPQSWVTCCAGWSRAGFWCGMRTPPASWLCSGRAGHSLTCAGP
jgi:hypothetical protein